MSEPDRNEPAREIELMTALARVRQRLADAADAVTLDDGPGALAAYCCAKATNEENYLLQKLFRSQFRTNNIDHCTRLCHAGSVAALIKALGTTDQHSQVQLYREGPNDKVLGLVEGTPGATTLASA